MTKENIQEWVRLGMDIGAHSLTHADLTKISEERAQMEIVDCKKSSYPTTQSGRISGQCLELLLMLLPWPPPLKVPVS